MKSELPRKPHESKSESGGPEESAPHETKSESRIEPKRTAHESKSEPAHEIKSDFVELPRRPGTGLLKIRLKTFHPREVLLLYSGQPPETVPAMLKRRRDSGDPVRLILSGSGIRRVSHRTMTETLREGDKDMGLTVVLREYKLKFALAGGSAPPVRADERTRAGCGLGRCWSYEDGKSPAGGPTGQRNGFYRRTAGSTVMTVKLRETKERVTAAEGSSSPGRLQLARGLTGPAGMVTLAPRPFMFPAPHQ